MTITVTLTEEEFDALDEVLREGWNGGEFVDTIQARYKPAEARKRAAATERAMLALHSAHRAAGRTQRVG